MARVSPAGMSFSHDEDGDAPIMKVVVFENNDWSTPATGVPDVLELVDTPERLAAVNADTYADMEVACIFLGSRLDAAALRQLPKLRYIVTRSTGVDHIDIAFCTRRGIQVCNVPSYGDPTIAEHTFALLLMIAHRMAEATRRTRAGHFSSENLRGFDLCGKTIGVVGTGAIGRSVVRIACGFDMNVLANDINPDPSFARGWNARYVPLDVLLSQSDIVSLHVPLTSDTQGMIDESAFRRMKNGVVFINTARGEVAETDALLTALQSGKVAAAGLDVVADEHLLRNAGSHKGTLSPTEKKHLELNKLLLEHPAVVATPHSAFNTDEALQRINQTTLENLIAISESRPVNLVTPEGI